MAKASRRILALTDKEVHLLRRAITCFVEDGYREPHDMRAVSGLDRQLDGNYTPAERVAIYAAAVDLSKDAK